MRMPQIVSNSRSNMVSCQAEKKRPRQKDVKLNWALGKLHLIFKEKVFCVARSFFRPFSMKMHLIVSSSSVFPNRLGRVSKC